MHGALFLFSVFGFKTVVLFFVVLGRLSGRMQELVSRMCPVSRNRAAVLCLVFALLWSCVSSNRADVLCLVISRANLRKRLRGWPGAPPVSDKKRFPATPAKVAFLHGPCVVDCFVAVCT